MALPAAFLDELRARTPLADVIGRRVRLTRSGRQWKGCCPFHGEKTPSFYVYDDHFHCFGCGAHGDAISFVMQSQGAAFPEAVAQLAAEAGLEVPKPTAEAGAMERRRADLHDVLAAAGSIFQRRLFEPDGRAALEYLRQRGLGDDTIHAFSLGWSGAGRGALTTELAARGIESERLAEAGLLRPADPETGPAREFFFNRVMFPIHDRQGRMISFGGRTLGEGQPKYLNGPETAVFAKRRSLYGLHRAREAMHGGAALIVVEGYMDVIALRQSGFAGAVAPLGTAMTEEQLQELWRVSPAPILCFDGDAAGARAAERAIELGLPLLNSGRTLLLARLPDGEDPDSIVQRRGASGLRSYLDTAEAFDDAVFGWVERASGGWATPQTSAAFRDRLVATARMIPDRSLAAEFRSALLNRFFERHPNRRRALGSSRPPASRPIPSRGAVSSERARILTALIVQFPSLTERVDEAFRTVALPPPLGRLRDAIMTWAEDAQALDSQVLVTHLEAVGLSAELQGVFSAASLPLRSIAERGLAPMDVEAEWWHFFGLISGVERVDAEVAQASHDLAVRWDERAQRRLIALRLARQALVSDEPRA